MKLLLDENLPKRLKSDLNAHTVFTVADMNWQGKKNGELMKLLTESGFDVFITFDHNIKYQQNLNHLKVIIIQLSAADNTYISLQKLVPALLNLLNSNPEKQLYEIFGSE